MTRGRTVLVALVGALIVVAGAAQTWASGPAGSSAGGTGVALAATGSQLAPGLGALALVGAAGAVATTLAGRIGRYLCGGAVVLAGLGAGALTAALLVDLPGAAARYAVRAGASAADGSAPVTSPGWAWVVLFGALVLVAAGLLVLIAGRAWPAPRSRTRESLAPASPGAPAGDPATASPGGGPRAVADDWERLSRGDDPTL